MKSFYSMGLVEDNIYEQLFTVVVQVNALNYHIVLPSISVIPRHYLTTTNWGLLLKNPC